MRPSSHPECRPVRRRPPRRLLAEPGALVTRGLAELRPRRLACPKLAATAVRQMAFGSHCPVDGAVVHVALSLEEASVKLSAKRWQALATRSAGESPRPPLDTPDGWGVGAFVLAGPGAANGRGRPRTVASFDGLLPGETMNLDSGHQIRD